MHDLLWEEEVLFEPELIGSDSTGLHTWILYLYSITSSSTLLLARGGGAVCIKLT